MSSNTFNYQEAHIEDDRRTAVIVASVICVIGACVAVALRLIARKIVQAKLQSDDWMIILGLLLTIINVIDISLGVHFGVGRHMILNMYISNFAKNTIASEVLYSPTMLVIKASILLLYKRIFPSLRFHYLLYGVGAFILAFTTAAIFVAIFQCVPIEANWNPGIPHTCIKIAVALITLGVLNTVTSAVILILPVPQLWHLQISKPQRLQLIGVFLTGGLVTIISITRVAYLFEINLVDASWTETDTVIWTTAEICTAVVSACLPTLRPLFNQEKMGSQRALSRNKIYVSHSYGVTSVGAAAADPFPVTEFEVRIPKAEGGESPSTA